MTNITEVIEKLAV